MFKARTEHEEEPARGELREDFCQGERVQRCSDWGALAHVKGMGNGSWGAGPGEQRGDVEVRGSWKAHTPAGGARQGTGCESQR